MSSKRRDIEATRRLAANVLKAIAPLSDTLLPAREPLAEPDLLCAPPSASLEPHLGVLRWLLEPEERLQALGVGDRAPHGRVGAVVDAAKGRIASALDKDLDGILVAVTDRRILSAGTHDFLKQGLFENEVDLADVRYVRSVPGNGQCESRVDLVTRDQNLDLYFAPEVDTQAVAQLAGLRSEEH